MDPEPQAVYLEVGKRTGLRLLPRLAGVVPVAKTEESALEALAAYAPR